MGAIPPYSEVTRQQNGEDPGFAAGGSPQSRTDPNFKRGVNVAKNILATDKVAKLKQRLQDLKGMQEMMSSGGCGGFVAGTVGQKNADTRPQKKYKPTVKELSGSNPVVTRDGTVVEAELFERLMRLREAVDGNNVDPTGNSYPAAGTFPGTDDPTGMNSGGMPKQAPQKPKKPAKRYSGKEYKPDGQIKSTWRPVGVQNPSGAGRSGATTSDYSIPNVNAGQQTP
jgi:hypothetical protein